MAIFRVLVADDDDDDLFILGQALDEVCPENVFEWVKNGEQLLEHLYSAFTNGKALPQLILLDINMPRMDGITALTKLKGMRHFAHIPVIMYTTASSEVYRQKCLDLGAKDFVTKASRYEDIIGFIESINGPISHV